MTNTFDVARLAPAAHELADLHPRPQLQRQAWTDLTGRWDFAYGGDEDADRYWDHKVPMPQTITVPFPPESLASGVGDTGYHSVLWYRRSISWDDLQGAGWESTGDRVLLHFGAVDYHAQVWLDGHVLGAHEGGHTPFSFDITTQLGLTRATETQDQSLVDPTRGRIWSLAVRAEDDPLDVAQPRGKQDWQQDPHGIWYDRTSGIWQPVWLEVVPAVHITRLDWAPDIPAGAVSLDLELNCRPARPINVQIEIAYEDELLERLTFEMREPRTTTVIKLSRQRNGQAHEGLLWSPENPRLLSARVTVTGSDLAVDCVASYFGLRSVGFAAGRFLLNDRPYYIRAVLEQGYWPDTHLAAPSPEALRQQVLLTKQLGFNTVRLHQKVEDPRYLYWADRLGLMVWTEAAAAYEYSPTALQRTTQEWIDVVRRDKSHPCVVVWVPLNESWGVQHISHDQAQLNFAQALYHLTRALDPTRPVISNDGWEHADSDIWTVHDYATTGHELAAGYTDAAAIERLLGGIGPLGRRMRLLDAPDRGQPVIVSEFGGISYAPSSAPSAWGYATVTKPDLFEALLRELFSALQASPVLAGFCYTQLADTLQEANGLLDLRRQPKIPSVILRSIVLGDDVDTGSHRQFEPPTEHVHPDTKIG